MSRIQRILRIAAVVLVAVCAYSNVLDNDFVYDDGAQILRNYYIRDTSYLRQIWTTNVWSFLGPHAVSNYYRPIMHMVFMADYALFGYSAPGYHATSILFHTLNAILVLAVADALLFPSLVALGGALLFAAHPIGTEAVTWVAGVPEITCAFFFLLSFWAYLRARPVGEVQSPRSKVGRRWVWLAVSAIASLLALFSKETALMLLPAIVLYEHLLRSRMAHSGSRVSVRNLKAAVRGSVFYLPHVGAVALYLAMRIHSLGGFQVATNPYGVLAPHQHVFSVLYLYGKYVWKLICPAPFNIFYVFYPARSLFDWRALAGLAVLALTVAAAWSLRRRGNSLAVALVILALPLVPVMDMRAIGHNVFAERYLYVPIAGFCWLVAAGVGYIYLRQRALALALLALLVANYVLLTRYRNREWHDNITLYTATLLAAPDATLIRGNLGQSYLDGRPDLALAEFTECIRRSPTVPEYPYRQAEAYAELRRYDEALAALDRSLALWDRYPEAYLARGDIYRELDDTRAAEEAYRHALEIKPGYAEVHLGLGALFQQQGRLGDAEASFRRAFEINDLSDAHLRLGLLELQQQRYPEAESEFRHTLISDQYSVTAWHGLGKALNAQGKAAEAATCFRRALNELKYAHPRRLGRVPLPDAPAIERDLASAEYPKSI